MTQFDLCRKCKKFGECEIVGAVVSGQKDCPIYDDYKQDADVSKYEDAHDE